MIAAFDAFHWHSDHRAAGGEGHKYDLVLLDFKLPCMTVVELFRKIQETHSDIKGLLITAYASPETEQAASAAGLQRVLRKPVDVPRLSSMIDQLTSATNHLHWPAGSAPFR